MVALARKAVAEARGARRITIVAHPEDATRLEATIDSLPSGAEVVRDRRRPRPGEAQPAARDRHRSARRGARASTRAPGPQAAGDPRLVNPELTSDLARRDESRRAPRLTPSARASAEPRHVRRDRALHVRGRGRPTNTRSVAGELDRARAPLHVTRRCSGKERALALPLLAILLFHEFGHYIAARLHRVPASLPFFLPPPGAEPVRHRRAPSSPCAGASARATRCSTSAPPGPSPGSCVAHPGARLGYRALAGGAVTHPAVTCRRGRASSTG